MEHAPTEPWDIRVGRIVDVELLSNARYTTHKLTVDFGPTIGHKVSGARLIRYELADLVGRLVLGVVNLPPRQIGHLRSEVLTIGVPGADGECVLLRPDDAVPLGGKVY